MHRHLANICLWGFMLFALNIHAQQDITASGGDAAGSGGTASFSLGQMNYTYITGAGGNATLGVQQSNVMVPASALNFDGTDDAIEVGHHTLLNFDNTDDITIEFWFNTTASGVIVSKFDNVTQVGYVTTIESSGEILAGKATEGGAVAATIKTDNAYNDGTWHHCAAVMAGDDATNYVFYIDGAQVSSSIVANALSAGTESIQNTAPLQIGNFIGTDHYNGDLDELRIWNEARTQAQVQEFKDCEFDAPVSGLVANYHFNHGNAAVDNTGVTTLADESGNSLDGQLSGFTLDGSTSNWIEVGGVVTGTSCNSLALVDLDDPMRLFAYPNPTQRNVTITFPNTRKMVKTKVLSLSGTVLQSTVHHEVHQLDLELDCPSGIYFIEISDETRTSVVRIVKQ